MNEPPRAAAPPGRWTTVRARARRARRSIAARLVLMFALAALVTFMLAGAALYAVLDRELIRHQDDTLRTAVQTLQYTIERYGDVDRWGRITARMDTLSSGDGGLRFWVLSDDPRFRHGRDLERLVAQSAAAGTADEVADLPGRVMLPGHAAPLRTLSRHIAALGDRPPVRLVVGIDTAPYARTSRIFLAALAILFCSAVLLVVGAGFWLARLGLRPLQRLSDAARALRPREAAQRLPVADLPAELCDLADAFNGALDRLDVAYRQLEAFNADVAHELRTPLANLIGGTQVALSRPRSAGQFEDALRSNLEELERLRYIVNDMLFLARADQGAAATSMHETAVVDEVHKTVEFFEFVLDETRSSVSVEGDLGARALLETALFRRALSNLLHNAVQHSPPAARIVVRVAEQADAVWVSVSNPGAAIAEVHLPRLFDRFYRVDASRHDGDTRTPGHGLGLAIVQAVAAMHGGRVAAASADGMTTIGFCVPRRRPA